MDTNKKVIIKNVGASNTLEVGTSTTLSFYILERIQETTLSVVDYRVDKISGRTTTAITAWTNLSLVGVTNDIYSFDYTLSGVVAADKIKFTFRVLDEDGLESFVELNDFEILV